MNSRRSCQASCLFLFTVALLGEAPASRTRAAQTLPQHEVLVQTKHFETRSYGGRFEAHVVTKATSEGDLVAIARHLTRGRLIECPYGLPRWGDIRFFSVRQRRLLRGGTEAGLNGTVRPVAIVSWYRALGDNKGVLIAIRRPPNFTAHPVEYEPLGTRSHPELCP